MKFNRITQTSNPLLRIWGNVCGKIANVFFNQSLKYGDLFQIERDMDFLGDIEHIDDSFVWKEDD